MRVSKINNWFLLFLLISLLGCASPGYRMLYTGKYGTELSVNPDRVLLECEWLHDADTKNSYGFMMHVLDDENTVLTLVQGNVLSKAGCDRRLKKIGKILRTGKEIYIAGTGDLLNDPRTEGKASYSFPGKGTFHSNERTLGFAAIANEFGLCYDPYSGDEKPCPRDPFPVKNRK